MSNPGLKSTTRPALWRILTAAAAFSLFTACKGKAPIVVQTEKVCRRNLTELVTATGKLQPVVQVKISAEVSGEIVELPVKEGQFVHKGDLLVKIRRDLYEASLRSAEAGLRSAQAGEINAVATLKKAEAELHRNEELFTKKLVSDSTFDDVKATYEISKANVDSAHEQVEMNRASVKKADEDLLKTTIISPIDGTVSALNSEKGERVVGTGMMAGTEIMTVADLDAMEARVEVSEADVVLIELGQKSRIEVDSFRDKKFHGTVTQVARSAKTSGTNTQQESTKFEVRIRLLDKEPFLPGMSVTAEVETRYRTNVLTVPIQSVTTRLPKDAKVDKPENKDDATFAPIVVKKANEANKPHDVVFVVDNSKAKMLQVKRGISDETYYEILDGLTEGQQVVTGTYKAISKELEDDRAVKLEDLSKKKDEPKKG